MTLYLLPLLACTKSGGKGATDDSSAVAEGCAFDTDESAAANALTLDAAAPTEAELCPEGDQDWYAMSVPAGDDLLTIDLGIDAPLSSLDVSYNVYLPDGATVVASPSSGEAATAGKPISVTHGLGAGDYLLRVRDLGDDAEDENHPYSVGFSTEPDPDANEPNNSASDATASGTDVEGYVAYREDEDWFSFTAPDRGLAHITLEMAAGGIAPSFQVLDAKGTGLVSYANESGNRKDTLIDIWQAIDVAGTYYVVVSDDDLTEFDDAVPYTLTVDVQTDPDTNEPNDDALTATELGSQACNTGFGTMMTRTGYLAASGDNDWYALDVSGCTNGVIEYSVDFDNPGALPTELTTQVRLVREVDDQSCTENAECGKLTAYPCVEDLDCQYVGNDCDASGFCAGAGLCLDTGHCTASVISDTALDLTPGNIKVAAPIRGWSRLFVTVADAGSDANSVTEPYQLNVHIEDDPDPHEPNEMYYAKVAKDEWSWYHEPFATEIPIYDSTVDLKDPKEAPLWSSCATDPWTDGVLAYKYDQDWFHYPSPCPGEDCMVRISYQIDGGAIDHWTRLYHGSSAWFDIEFLSDSGSQSSLSGSYGGLAVSDECLYSYSSYDDYYLRVRDNAIAGDGNDGLWDFSSTQGYSLCVEKIADGCQSPCFDNKKYGCSTSP